VGGSEAWVCRISASAASRRDAMVSGRVIAEWAGPEWPIASWLGGGCTAGGGAGRDSCVRVKGQAKKKGRFSGEKPGPSCSGLVYGKKEGLVSAHFPCTRPLLKIRIRENLPPGGASLALGSAPQGAVRSARSPQGIG
jgi:hypothetical protein